MQVTWTFVTLALAVPLPFVTVQVSPLDSVFTVTAELEPEATAVGNAKEIAPDAGEMVWLPSASNRPLAVNPLIVPPMV